MTPAPSPRAWEPDFIRLWQAGASQAEVFLGRILAVPNHSQPSSTDRRSAPLRGESPPWSGRRGGGRAGDGPHLGGTRSRIARSQAPGAPGHPAGHGHAGGRGGGPPTAVCRAGNRAAHAYAGRHGGSPLRPGAGCGGAVDQTASVRQGRDGVLGVAEALRRGEARCPWAGGARWRFDLRPLAQAP
jgi:hypothetical protein